MECANGHVVADGVNFCPECGVRIAGDAADMLDVTQMTERERKELMDRYLVEYAKQGWHVHQRPLPDAVSLVKKTGLFGKAFLAVWLNDDGTLGSNFVGGTGVSVIPVVVIDGD